MPGKKESREQVIDLGQEDELTQTPSQMNIYEGTLIFSGEQINYIKKVVQESDPNGEVAIAKAILDKIRSSK